MIAEASFTFRFSLDIAGRLAVLVFALLIALYTVKMPLKGRRHHIFVIFVADLAIFFAVTLAANFAGSPETYYAVRILGPFPGQLSWPLLYHFILGFVSPKTNQVQKFTLVGAYAYVFGLWWAPLLLDPTLHFKGVRTTSTGYGLQLGPLAEYVTPFGITWFFIILTILMLAALLRYYRIHQSPFVRHQIWYLSLGILFISLGGNQGQFARYVGGITLLPYLFSAGFLVILLGLRKYEFFAIAPVAEVQSEAPLRYSLLQGFSYLAIESEPKQSFEVFSNLALNGHYGLCVTKSSPGAIRENYRLKTTPILWLTEEKSDDAVAPADLHGILVTIKAFLQKAERSVIMLHGLEYLVSINGFKSVLRLIVRLNDLIVQKNGILLIPVVQGNLTEKQQGLLSAECPSLQKLEVSQSGEAITSPFQPRQELHPLLANIPIPAETHVQEPLRFKREDAEKAFRFLAKAFLQDYTVSRLLVDASGWRTSMEIAEGASLPARKMYGRDGGPGPAIAELLKRGLVETRWVTGQRGRGGTIMKVRVNHSNPYVKIEIDRLALQP
ncbi:MAG: DUF835 domain-containing protein [Thaumarchaeota archaeon]|nr:DUF835 domain-containing protein [Nitrososphaerota archaeon]